jgi:hypothetical protein
VTTFLALEATMAFYSLQDKGQDDKALFLKANSHVSTLSTTIVTVNTLM